MNVFDLHCDTATELYRRNCSFDSGKTHINGENIKGHRLTQCFAVFFNDQKEFSDPWGFFDAVTDGVFPSLFREGLTPLLTVEGAGILACDPQWADRLSRANCRMAGLVWNGRNLWATGAATDDSAELTAMGKAAVLELIQRKIAVDVSHLSAAGTEEVLHITDAPIVASHSNAKAVCNHVRNLSDDVAREIFARGGLVGLNLYPEFLAEHEASADDILRHAEHFLSLGGTKGLALGCDFDGVDKLPRDIADFSSLIPLYHRFCTAFGKEIADGVFYRNAHRFFERLT